MFCEQKQTEIITTCKVFERRLMATSDTIEGESTLIILYWIRTVFNDIKEDNFPFDIIQLIIHTFLCKNPIFLSFSSEFKSKNISLSDDNKYAFKTEDRKYRDYVLLDIDPVKSGVHVWRFKVPLFSEKKP